jgi:hypothetical protein
MKNNPIGAKSQSDIVSAESNPVNIAREGKFDSLPGLAKVLELTLDERKAMFVTALRSRPGITKFSFRLGDYTKTKKEIVSIGGLKDLHNKSYEDIAAVLLAATQIREDFVGFEYSVTSDRSNAVVNKLEIEYGVSINPANCQKDEEGNIKDKKFGPYFSIEYTA